MLNDFSNLSAESEMSALAFVGADEMADHFPTPLESAEDLSEVN